jgi:hypothetical protein
MDRPDFIDSFKRDLLASEPSRPTLRRVPVPVLVAAAVAVLAIPAWATGLFGKAFPEDRHSPTRYPGEIGRRYVLDRGRTPDGHSFRLIGFRQRFRDASVRTCVELQVKPTLGRGNINGNLGETCTTRRELRHPVGLYDMGIKALHGRRIHAGMLPASVAILRLSWFSGKHVDLVPNRPDPVRLRASGIRLPFTYVAIVPPPGERFKGAEALDAQGKLVARLRNPSPAAPGERVPRSRSPLLDLRRYLGQP